MTVISQNCFYATIKKNMYSKINHEFMQNMNSV